MIRTPRINAQHPKFLLFLTNTIYTYKKTNLDMLRSSLPATFARFLLYQQLLFKRWMAIHCPLINHYPVEMENHVHICSLSTKLSNTFFLKYKGDITCSYYYFFNSHYFHPTYQIYSLHLKIQTQEFVSFFSSSFQVFPPLN